jgi:hypothetical protein
MDPITAHDTYQLHEQALSIDRAISQYLTYQVSAS